MIQICASATDSRSSAKRRRETKSKANKSGAHEAIRRRVIACVTGDFAVGRLQLRAGSRGSPHIALARQVAMYLCHTGFALNFEAIGRLFRRDRTTVAHACRTIEERRDDPLFDVRIAALERACGCLHATEEPR